MTNCNSCSGRGGMLVDEDYQLNWEYCLKCDGYGFISEDSDDAD